MAKTRIKVNDKVYVLTGKDEGKTGKVLSVNHKKMQVIVEGVNMQSVHKKPRHQQDTGGIIRKEGPIHISNVMYVCDSCKRPVKLGAKIHENGEKVRICKSCNEEISIIGKAKKA